MPGIKYMPSYGKTSQLRLDTCHPDLQLIFSTTIKKYDHSIFCGYRGQVGQDQAYREGLSQLRYPDSKHNTLPALAVDAGPYFVELSNTDWDDHKAFALFAGYVKRVVDELLEQCLISHRLRWGGDWDGDGRTADERFSDLPHFELVPLL